MSDSTIHLKISEKGHRIAVIDPMYYEYPSYETSGYLCSYLLKENLNYLFDRNYKDLRILDVGCGYGWAAEELAKQGGITCAVDISWSSCQASKIRFKKKGLDVSVVCCDAENLPFKEQAFDIGIFCASLHHLPNPVEGLCEVLRTADDLYIVDEPREVSGLDAILILASKILPRFRLYGAKAGLNYHSIMDESIHQRFNLISLSNFLRNKGYTVSAKGYWNFVPPFLQKTNNSLLIRFWKVTILVLNFALPNFGHTFFLRADCPKLTNSTRGC